MIEYKLLFNKESEDKHGIWFATQVEVKQYLLRGNASLIKPLLHKYEKKGGILHLVDRYAIDEAFDVYHNRIYTIGRKI